jgi:F420H(2)-dependent quinone reductase
MNPLAKLFISAHVFLFHATGGKMGSSMAGGPVLLLTTKGKKTGQPRTVPVMYFDSDGDRVVVASAGGSATHTAWFKNLDRDPNVTVEVKGKRYAAHAEVAAGEERIRIWKKVIGQQPRFAEYEKKAAGREIPIVVLKETSAA